MKLWSMVDILQVSEALLLLFPNVQKDQVPICTRAKRPTVPAQCICINQSHSDSDTCLWLQSSLNIFTTTDSIHKHSYCAWVTYTTHFALCVCVCVYAICVCGHSVLWFGVWEWPTIKTHSSAHCLNYRREHGWVRGNTPLCLALHHPPVSEEQTMFKYLCSTNKGCSIDMLLQVPLPLNLIGRLIWGPDAQP